MELTITCGGSVRYRVPLSDALSLLSQALTENGSAEKAEAALRDALDAIQRRVP